MKKTLIYIYIPSEFNFIKQLILYLKYENISHPIVLLDHNTHDLSKMEIECKKKDIDFININKKETFKKTKNNSTQVTKKPILNRKKDVCDICLFIYRTFKVALFFKKKKNFYKNIITNNRISSVICLTQGIAYNSSFLIAAAKKLNKKTIVIPFAITKEGLANKLKDNPTFSYKRLYNRVAYPLIKEFYINYKGRGIISKLPQEAMALKILGISSKNPWSAYAGKADYIISESPFMTKSLIEEKINSEKILELGSPIFFDNNKDNNSNFILLSLPPIDIKKSGLPEFKTNIEAVTFIFKTIYSLNYNNVIINLHPRSDSNSFKDLIEKYNFLLSEDPIESLIPNCWFYIAFVSSTIKWAIANSKPVINYDIFHYNYSHFNTNKGVLNIYDRNDFKKTLHKISSDKDFFNDLKSSQAKDSIFYGIPLNQSKDNYARFIEKNLT